MASCVGIPHDISTFYYLNSSHVEIHCGGPAGENVASFYWKLALGLGGSSCTIYMCGYIAISKSIQTLADSFQHRDPIDDELAEAEEGRTRPKPSRPVCSSGPSDSTSGCCGDEGVRPRSDFWRRIRQFLVRPDGWVIIMNYAVAMAASDVSGASMQISLPQPVSEPTV